MTQPGLSRARRRQIEGVLDRIEDRLCDAPEGLHEAGEGAEPEALVNSGLSEDLRLFWERWDGLALMHGETSIMSLEEQPRATREALEAELIRDGDRVVGERGCALLVLAADPWEEGADVILVEDDGTRSPYASTLPLLVLGVLGESTVLHDEDGEYRADLFGDDGELTLKAERRLLRRRLDLDPDAPMARFRLGQLLRRSGELKAAAVELRAVIKRAPTYAWAQFELGRTLFALGKNEPAERAFLAASEATREDGMRGLFLAWAARCGTGPRREAHAAAALEAYPGLAVAHEAAAAQARADGEDERARELVSIGLAVSPRHLGLLALSRTLTAS